MNPSSMQIKQTSNFPLTQTIHLHLPWIKSYSTFLFHIDCRSIGDNKYLFGYADPYSMIGDIGAPQKSYRNIKRLLDIMGIKYEELG